MDGAGRTSVTCGGHTSERMLKIIYIPDGILAQAGSRDSTLSTHRHRTAWGDGGHVLRARTRRAHHYLLVKEDEFITGMRE